MSLCPICGQAHLGAGGQTACPPTGQQMTINGMTPFELALLERIDRVIDAVLARQEKP